MTHQLNLYTVGSLQFRSELYLSVCLELTIILDRLNAAQVVPLHINPQIHNLSILKLNSVTVILSFIAN